MSTAFEIKVPDIGDFNDVEIIEVNVSPGDEIAHEDTLITLETDKATMDVPAPMGGRVKEVHLAVGDRVSEGTTILTLETTTAGKAEMPPEPKAPSDKEEPAPASTPGPVAGADVDCDLVVLGAGPGGYTAAFRAADLGLRTVLVERHAALGGVCLNVGCIPSKAYLHAAGIMAEVDELSDRGISYGKPQVDPAKLADWKDRVVNRLTGGLAGLAKQRKVQVIQGNGQFKSPNLIGVETADGQVNIGFRNAVIAVGSRPTRIPSFPHDDPRVWDSTDALRLGEVPKKLLVVGGGIIGLEMATVYDALGTQVSVVELLDGLIPGCDRDLVRPLEKRVRARYQAIYLGTRVTEIKAQKRGLKVSFEGKDAPASANFDAVLVAVGRVPNGGLIAAENAGISVDTQGFISVDKQQRTNVAHIFAIGDVVGQPMLAHKAVHEGKVAAENAAGQKSGFDAGTVPSVAYTDPEIAWMGLTESEAKDKGIPVEKGVFPWAASGRALGIGRDEGLTKLLFDKESGRIIGAGIVGAHAGELIGETVLALEMGADAQDIGLTIHPHPTLSETVCFAAEMAEGTITDLMPPKKK